MRKERGVRTSVSLLMTSAQIPFKSLESLYQKKASETFFFRGEGKALWTWYPI